MGKNGKKTLKAVIKRIITTVVLAGGLLFPPPSSAKPDVKSKSKTIQSRVKVVRAALVQKLADDPSAEGNLSYSENELAQWGNWGNWRNWANWGNWNNWNNWGNWGNWRNF
jgi:hypothetical protein